MRAADDHRSGRAPGRSRPSDSTSRRPRRSRQRRLTVAPTRSIEPRLGENHPARGRLQDTGDRDVEAAVDVPGATLDHDHRAVVEEADALAGLLALLDD